MYNPQHHYEIHMMEQRTPEWDAIRAGKFTASIASKLVTPKGNVSTQYKAEIARIIAEQMGLQNPEFIEPTYWMSRGIELEDDARGWFQVETGLVVKECGFIASECGTVGFSPDGYIDGEEIIPVELKCPKPSTHIRWLIDGVMPDTHLPQCHFALAITGAPYMYFMSYNPTVESIIQKVEANEMTSKMCGMIEKFKTELGEAMDRVTGAMQ